MLTMKCYLQLFVTLILASLAQSSPLSSSKTSINQQAPLAATLASAEPPSGPICDCAGTNHTGDHSYICEDPRLGPVSLPNRFPLLGIVSTYDRFGGLQPGRFLEAWWNASDVKSNYKGIPGSWKWPPADGFLTGINNTAVKATTHLGVGTILDRYGSTKGKFLAAADGPFNQRALPLSSLNADVQNADFPSDYHVYVVVKDMPVVGGLVAPWFGQPGLGSQFYVGDIGQILNLTAAGYIVRLNKTQLLDPNDRNGRCGQGFDVLQRRAWIQSSGSPAIVEISGTGSQGGRRR